MTAEHKKKLGAYYTPELVTDVLSNWAIETKKDKILEPSFGGCNFLISSLKVLKNLGSKAPSNNIYGFDIDSKAFDILNEKKIKDSNFFHQDFLETQSSQDISFQVEVVLGNPPYLPIHKLSEEYKHRIYKDFSHNKFKIPKRSGLWIYFIVNSFKFLKDGGRMAWVVPDSISFTDYGTAFLDQISQVFKEVKLLRIDERYFLNAGTMEKTCLLLCKGYNQGTCDVDRESFVDLDEALNTIRYVNDDELKKSSEIEESLPLEIGNTNFSLSTLGDLFYVRIGIVIGATNLLVHNFNHASGTNFFPDFYYPIVTKGKQLKNLFIDKANLENDRNTQIYLLDVIKMQEKEPKLFRNFLDNFPEKVLINQTFRKRVKLFGYDDFKHPDAFLTFYSQGLPKLILNSNLELNCTNSLHRLYCKQKASNSDEILKFISLQFFCSFLGKETKNKARQYGNAILKYEPSDAAKIPVIIPRKFSKKFVVDLNKQFNQVCDLIDINQISDALSLTTEYLKQTIGLNPHSKNP